MQMNPQRVSIPCDTWSYNGSFGYPSPCHGCFNHGYFPGYYTCQPPYPHYPQPMPFNCHRSYPPINEPYHVRYRHPSCYSMEQPRYEYDKNVSRDSHCCGCSNHLCNPKDNNNVRIVEEEPEGEKQKTESLVPMELKNYPYPVVWIPPGYLKNGELGKLLESDVKSKEEVPHKTEAAERAKSFESSAWNGWFPLKGNNLGSLRHGGDEKRTQDGQSEDRKNQFSLPIIWMPSSEKAEKDERENHKDSNAAPKSTEEPTSQFRMTPLKLLNGDDSEKKSGTDESELEMTKKDAKKNSRLAEQMEAHGEPGVVLGQNGGKVRDIPVMHVEDSGKEKSYGSSTQRQLSSQSKMSKLPPICLRVDPLPKRKNGNGSSRSPSPPAHKGNRQEPLDKMRNASALVGFKDSNQQDLRAGNIAADKSRKVETDKKESRTFEVTETPAKKKDENVNEERDTENTLNLPNIEVSGNLIAAKEKPGPVAPQGNIAGEKEAKDGKSMKHDDASGETEKPQQDNGESKKEMGVGQSEEGKFEEVCKAKKKNLSDEEAALAIQAAYRGYEVRKWEPLKKLKLITKVHEQIADIDNCIQALCSSLVDQNFEKQRLMIGESIMSLLLKLDTIQGLHPSIREVRKSVARELTRLQEKLDSLSMQESGGLIKGRVNEPEDSVDTHNDERAENKEEKEEQNIEDFSSDDGNHVLAEVEQCHSSHMEDIISGFQSEVAPGHTPHEGEA